MPKTLRCRLGKAYGVAGHATTGRPTSVSSAGKHATSRSHEKSSCRPRRLGRSPSSRLDLLAGFLRGAVAE